MRDVSSTTPIDWYRFPDPTGKRDFIEVNLSFLASSWECQFGKGCPGCYPKKAKHTVPDLGCCVKGFYVYNEAEFDRLNNAMTELTSEDWDDDLRTYVYKHSAWVIERPMKDHEDGSITGSVKSRTVNRGCVFANRADGSVGSTGKIGCAFLHMSNRLKEQDITSNQGHTDHMPRVCWQLPLSMQDDGSTIIIDAWSANNWTTEGEPTDPDGTTDSWAHWWCVDSPSAYTAQDMLAYRMEAELRLLLGDEATNIIFEKLAGYGTELMPAERAVIDPADHRLLPIVATQTIDNMVGDRTPKRGA